jgi:hypothetical protein
MSTSLLSGEKPILRSGKRRLCAALRFTQQRVDPKCHELHYPMVLLMMLLVMLVMPMLKLIGLTLKRS